jgi:hypothetical protein
MLTLYKRVLLPAVFQPAKPCPGKPANCFLNSRGSAVQSSPFFPKLHSSGNLSQWQGICSDRIWPAVWTLSYPAALPVVAQPASGLVIFLPDLHRLPFDISFSFRYRCRCGAGMLERVMGGGLQAL